MTTQQTQKQFGVLAEFTDVTSIYRASEKVAAQGFRQWDTHTPFPVHGLERAMKLPRSRLPWIVLAMGLTGGAGGLLLQWWINVVEYPLVISGKPLFSWPAFMPVMFELTVLLSAFGAVFGMFGLNKLPQLYHSAFRSDRFARATDDRFFITIEATDPKFDPVATPKLLKDLGASHVEMLEH